MAAGGVWGPTGTRAAAARAGRDTARAGAAGRVKGGRAEMALTERSAEVLRAIYELAMSRGYCPTVREVGARVGLASSSSVWFQVERLRRAGYVTDDIGKARTLRL